MTTQWRVLLGRETVVLHSIGSGRPTASLVAPLAGLGELRATVRMVISVLLGSGPSRLHHRYGHCWLHLAI